MNKILIVEDDPILGSVYKNHLQKAGYETALEKDGASGLLTLQKLNPDLVILDIVLPKVSGTEMLKMLRADARFQRTPVLVFTSTFQRTILTEVQALNPTEILPKSKYTPKEVVAIVDKLLKNLAGGKPLESDARRHDPRDSKIEAKLWNHLKERLEKCRSMGAEANKQTDPDLRACKLRALAGFVHNLGGGATAAGLKGQAYFCDALENLVEEVSENTDKLSPSNMRTITQAVDFLFEEFDGVRYMDVPDHLGFNVLVVDDDPISRRAICVALDRINQRATEPKTAQDALDVARKTRFDLIFLDIDMPEMNGFDLCAEIRKTEANRGTPVIFVTGLTDLQSRAKSMLSGGNDFIGKPFQFMELGVKALIHLLRNKLR